MHSKYRIPNLGELPDPLFKERQPGPAHDPSAGLYLEWVNQFRTTNFFSIATPVGNNVLQEQPLRCYLLVQNLDPVTDLFLSFGSEARIGQSVMIIPRGNYELIGGQAGGSFVPKSTVNLIASANVNVSIVEGTLEPRENIGRF